MKTKVLAVILFCLFLNKQNIAQSNGGNATGGDVYCASSPSGFLGLSGQNGMVIDWIYSVNGGPWQSLGTSTVNPPYNSITQNTCYRAIVQSGAWPPDTSTATCFKIYPQTVAGTIAGTDTFCGPSGASSITLNGNVGTPLYWESSTTGGAPWTTIASTSTTLNYPNLTTTTYYQAVVQDSTLCTIKTTPPFKIEILPVSIAGSLSHSGNDTACYRFNSSSINLTGNAGNITGWMSSTDMISWTNIVNTSNSLSYSGLLQETYYEVIVKNGPCPSDTSAPIKVNMYPIPGPVNAGTDTTIFPGTSIVLNGTGTGTPYWQPNTTIVNANTFNPTVTPPSSTPYMLYVSDVNSCINIDTVMITVILPDFRGVVTNYFSPDGDNINDTWYIEDIQMYKNNEVSVYNIYGNEVFSKQGYQNDWKGTYNGADLPDGTYYYVLKFSDSNVIRKGSIDILRKK